MKFNIIRDLTNDVYSVKIMFDSFGSEEMSKEDELKILDDHGPAIINVGGKFIGKYIDGEVQIGEPTEEEVNAIKLELVRNLDTVELNEGMIVDYKIDANSIIMTDRLTEAFKTKDKVAEAKAELFVAVIKQRIEDAVTEWKKSATDFDTYNPEEFVV